MSPFSRDEPSRSCAGSYASRRPERIPFAAPRPEGVAGRPPDAAARPVAAGARGRVEFSANLDGGEAVEPRVLCTRCEALVPSYGRCPVCGRRVGVAAPAVPDPPLLEPGTRVLEYDVESVISHHGRRRTYSVAGPAGGGAAVLKELCLEGQGERRREDVLLQFERERAILGRLRHPRIPRLLGHEDRGERRYLAIERMAGAPLRREWRARGRRPFPEAEALAVAAALADVLVSLHEAAPPVLHRDLSPGNVLYAPGEPGMVSVIDFGIAASPGEPTIRVFTQGFDPPERHFGPSEGPASDLYGLGAILHFLLAGVDPARFPPFQYPPLRELAPAVSARSEALCLWLLQPDPARRPADARAVLGALRGAEAVPVAEASRLARAIEDADAATVRLLARHAGGRRDPREALDIAQRLAVRGSPGGARRVLLDALETLRVERDAWDERVAAPVLIRLAELYLFTDDGGRALAVCEEARALAPGDGATELLAARALALLGREPEALACLDGAPAGGASGPGDVSAVAADRATLRAERLLAAGRAGEAERAARVALALDPRGFEAMRALDRAAVHPSRAAELEARLAAAPAAVDSQARVDLALARLAAPGDAGARAQEERALDDALAALRAGVAIEPPAERRLLRFHIRRAAEDEGALEAALGLADEAIARHPRAPFFGYYAGMLAYLLGRADDALARFEALIALGDAAEPDGEADGQVAGARAELWRGRSLEKLGRKEEALAAFRRAVAAAPGHREAVRELYRLGAELRPAGP